MDKLSKSEIKILKILDSHVGIPSDKVETLKFLMDTLAFNHHQALDYYKLWYLNQEDIIPYEEMEDIDRGTTFLTNILDQIIKSENSPHVILDKIHDENEKDYLKLLGPWWYRNCNRYSGNLPCIDWEDDGIVLNLGDLQWEQYFSGLGEDEAWRYKAAISYYQENQEDFQDEEFDYAIYNDETINKFKELAEIAGVDKWPGKDDAPIPEEEISNFLESLLPTGEFDTIRQDYLWALGTAISSARNKAIVELYDEEVNYPIVSCDAGGSYCIKIPYDSLMAIVKDRDLLNLSELKEAEVNGQIYLEDTYYDTWYDAEGREEVISEFNYVLGSTIDKFNEEGNDLKEIMGKIKNFNETLKKIGLKYDGSHWSHGQLWKSEDGKLVVYSNDFDHKTNKVKIQYDGESHLIPLEDLSNWAHGSVLDLNESVRIGKYRLMMETIEQPDNITKIAIFDFDGTLMDTPHPDTGKKEWEEKTGKEYPHIGWWSKRESLDTNVFDIQSIKSTIVDYFAETDDPNTLVIMLTGRLPQQADQVEKILNNRSLIFDEYHYKGNGATLNSKINTIKSLLNRYPNVDFIEMYEDREPHAISFEEWGKENGVNIKVNLVTDAQEAFK
jgi:hypothetical protein